MSAGLAVVLQQAALMAKRATFRTAGIVGDDLAINCKQLMGAQPERELPMIFAIAKGSLKNKAILIPCALGLSLTLPGLIMPVLTAGGAYLCYEGIEKFLHKPKKPETPGKPESAVHDHAAWEKRRVRKAIKTDLILSCEIVAVALWTVAGAPFLAQALALTAAGVAMTAGVYGVVAGIIKLDDLGHAMAKKEGKGLLSKATRGIGRFVAKAAPPLIKTIGVVGTVAMFLVGGGMVVHGLPGGEHLMTTALGAISSNPVVQAIATGALETAAGVAAGFVAIPIMKVIEPPIAKVWELGKKLVGKLRAWKKDSDDDNDEEAAPSPSPAPSAEPAKDALRNTPEVKADLNTAAIKLSNDNAAAPTAPAPAENKPPEVRKPGP